MTAQHWDEEAFCQSYARTWEIATDEVHYGWLAPGERSLRLIDLDLVGARVLDIGCGMGENLAALARQGANGYGIDISAHMLARARRTLAPFEDQTAPVHLQQQDMRQTDFFPGMAFDLVLSVYSLEYLHSTREFKDLCYNLFRRLKPGGLFIFCFSHQLQHVRHRMLANHSRKSGDDPYATLIYSFRDVVGALTEVGFLLERVVEQGTRNPSRLSYEDACRFPYHFHRDQNPCMARFDAESNRVPHTVIYKARKLGSQGPTEHPQLKFDYGSDSLQIWGQKRRITGHRAFNAGDRHYQLCQLAAKDSVVALCEVMTLEVTAAMSVQAASGPVELNIDGERRSQYLEANSVQSLIHDALLAADLAPCYARSTFAGSEGMESGLYIKRIDPLHGLIHDLLPRQQLGILVFINGEEPAQGTISLADILPAPGDRIQVIYIATRWGRAWRPRGDNDQQLDLFP